MQESKQGAKNSEELREVEGLPVVRREVAGIDLGSQGHWVCGCALRRFRGAVARWLISEPPPRN
jgi:hypothetical protein